MSIGYELVKISSRKGKEYVRKKIQEYIKDEKKPICIGAFGPSTTKAVKVHSFPRMASSTSSIVSFGNRMLFVVVGGILGILYFLIATTHISHTLVFPL